MPYIGDSRKERGPGYLALQDHGWKKQGIPLQMRTGLLAVRVKGRLIDAGELGHHVIERGSVGDITGGQLWLNEKSDRPGPMWRFGPFAAKLWGGPFSGQGGGTAGTGATTPGGGANVQDFAETPSGSASVWDPVRGLFVQQTTGATESTPSGGFRPNPARLISTYTTELPALPVGDAKWDHDDRFKEEKTKSPRTEDGRRLWPYFPADWFGITTTTTREDEQETLFLPTDPRLMAVNHGRDPSYGTLVCDMANQHVDPDRVAPLHSLTRVVKGVGGGKLSLSGPRSNALSWNIGASGQGDTLGGLITDDAAGHARVSVRDGGPFSVGLPTCKHTIGKDADGNDIRMAHLSTLTLFEAEGGTNKDGPLEFTKKAYPYPTPLPYFGRVHVSYDRQFDYRTPRDSRELSFRGAWRLYSEFPLGVTTPPGGPPTTPSGPPTPGGPPTGSPPTTGGPPPTGPTTPPGGPPTGGGGGDDDPPTTGGGGDGAPPWTGGGGDGGTYPPLPPDSQPPGVGDGAPPVGGGPGDGPTTPSPGDGLPPYDPFRPGYPLPDDAIGWGPYGPVYPGPIPPPWADGYGPPGGTQTPGSPPMLGTPDPENPFKPQIVPGEASQGRQERPTVVSHLEFAPNSIVHRAFKMESGGTDWAAWQNPSPSQLGHLNATAPAVMREVAFAAQGGNTGTSGAEGGDPFTYTQEPGSSRSHGGTAAGMVLALPPEVDLTDAGTDFAPDGVTTSETGHLNGPGVMTAWGTPDLATGGVDEGVRIMRSGTSEVVVQTKASGAAWVTVGTINPGVRIGRVPCRGITANGPVVAGEAVIINVVGGNVTATLPGSPADGDCVRLRRYGANVATVERNGNEINDVAANFVFAADGDAHDFTFDSTTGSWWTF